jgi:hypothetical protein
MSEVWGKYTERVEPEWARLDLSPPSFRRTATTEAMLRGRRYERAAQAELLRRYGPEYVPEMWFQYSHKGKMKWCQLDGLLINLQAVRLTIVEIKLQFTPLALRQMCYLYVPVIRKVFPGWAVHTCAMVKWFDCAVRTEGPVKLRKEVHETRPEEVGVHVWNPKHKFKVA